MHHRICVKIINTCISAIYRAPVMHNVPCVVPMCSVIPDWFVHLPQGTPNPTYLRQDNLLRAIPNNSSQFNVVLELHSFDSPMGTTSHSFTQSSAPRQTQTNVLKHVCKLFQTFELVINSRLFLVELAINSRPGEASY